MTPYLFRLVTAMYGEELSASLAESGLETLAEPPEWLLEQQAAFIAASVSPARDCNPLPDVVMASTCVDHCKADPSRLAATVLADLTHGAAIARLLNRPLLSVVGIAEETLLVPGGQERASAWHDVADSIAEVFKEFTIPEGSRLVSTADDQMLWSLLEVVETDRSHLADSDLDGLYHLLDGSCFPHGTPFGFYYGYYRMNIAHYRRPVIERLMGPAPGGVLIVENIQQSKAIAIVRSLNRGWPTEHLATLPAPGRTGRDRATRSTKQDAILLSTFLRDPGSALEGADPDVQNFWHTTDDLFRRTRAEGMIP